MHLKISHKIPRLEHENDESEYPLPERHPLQVRVVRVHEIPAEAEASHCEGGQEYEGERQAEVPKVPAVDRQVVEVDADDDVHDEVGKVRHDGDDGAEEVEIAVMERRGKCVGLIHVWVHMQQQIVRIEFWLKRSILGIVGEGNVERLGGVGAKTFPIFNMESLATRWPPQEGPS